MNLLGDVVGRDLPTISAMPTGIHAFQIEKEHILIRGLQTLDQGSPACRG